MDYELLYTLAVNLAMATVVLAKGEISRIKREAHREIQQLEATVDLLQRQLEEAYENL